MNILVCVKISGGELSPFDACAVEAALRIAAQQPEAGRITVVSMGPPTAKGALEKLTRLGAEAVLLSDAAFAGADTLATAYALSMAARQLGPDLILCGRQSLDGDTAQTGPCLAALLGLPVLTDVLSLQVSGGAARCVTRLGEEEAALPAVVTVERFLSLRFPHIGAKRGAVKRLSAADIGAETDRCGLRGSPTRVIASMECTAGRRSCQFIPPSGFAAALAAALEKPRAALPVQAGGKKLREVWCIGEAAADMARTIAEQVTVIPPDTPAALAEQIRAAQPPAVLWEASVWGRRNAPQAAALLRTGLCADCTALETDGEQLYMIRPAKGGSVTAKILCRSRPPMATVRCACADTRQVVVGLGIGAAEQLQEWMRWTQAWGYEWAASRRLVDRGGAPYDRQIGLTGRSVRPQVYLAVGISGAIQHTCAVEGAGTVIAVNPDSTARVFDYADYGIVCTAEDFLKENGYA